MKTKIIQNIKAIILGLVVTVGVGYAGAAWNPAPSTGPQNAATNNAPAPINVGNIFQTKLGGVGVTDLIVSNSFQFATGTQPIKDKVLVALDNAGNVGWGTVSGGSGNSNQSYGYDVQCTTYRTTSSNGDADYHPYCLRLNKSTGVITVASYNGNSSNGHEWGTSVLTKVSPVGVGPYSLLLGIIGYNTAGNIDSEPSVAVCILNKDGNSSCTHGYLSNATNGFSNWTSLANPF